MAFAQGIRDIGRINQIARLLFKYELGYLIDQLKLKDYLSLNERLNKKKFEEREAKPYVFRLMMEELGGAFIKLGQLLSLRPDLIPKEYCDEFAKLQDNVKPFPFEDAKKIIENELKKPLGEVFSKFSNESIASASIGQVYSATLRKTNERVVIKVKRPRIELILKTDIELMLYLAKLIESHFPTNIINPSEIVNEFKRYTENELDYLKEARNIEKFYANFAGDKKVEIPKLFREYTTSNVLVMEYIHGIKIGLIKRYKLNKKKIVKNIVDAVFTQIFIHGFFHADPHPGNILLLEDYKIAFLDFGIVGRLDEDIKNSVFMLFKGLIEKNLDDTANAMLKLGVVDYDINPAVLKEDIQDSLGEFYNVPVEQIKLSAAFNNMINLAKRENIRFPSNFVLLGKSIITLEGVALQLDPKFNLVEAAMPFVKKVMKMKTSPREIVRKIGAASEKIKDFMFDIPDKTNLFFRRFKETDENLKNIDKDIKTLTLEMDRSSNRIAYAMIITGFIIAGALTIQFNQYLIFDIPFISFICFLAAFILIAILLISILRERRKI